MIITQKNTKLENNEEHDEKAMMRIMKKRTVLIIGSVLRIPEKAMIMGTFNEGCYLTR